MKKHPVSFCVGVVRQKTFGNRLIKPQNETWQGEKEEELPDDLDEFDAVDIYEQICEQRRKRGYEEYSSVESLVGIKNNVILLYKSGVYYNDYIKYYNTLLY